jgi:hypothetical protein
MHYLNEFESETEIQFKIKRGCELPCYEKSKIVIWNRSGSDWTSAIEKLH